MVTITRDWRAEGPDGGNEKFFFLFSLLFFNPHPRTYLFILEREEGRERERDIHAREKI